MAARMIDLAIVAWSSAVTATHVVQRVLRCLCLVVPIRRHLAQRARAPSAKSGRGLPGLPSHPQTAAEPTGPSRCGFHIWASNVGDPHAQTNTSDCPCDSFARHRCRAINGPGAPVHQCRTAPGGLRGRAHSALRLRLVAGPLGLKGLKPQPQPPQRGCRFMGPQPPRLQLCAADLGRTRWPLAAAQGKLGTQGHGPRRRAQPQRPRSRWRRRAEPSRQLPRQPTSEMNKTRRDSGCSRAAPESDSTGAACPGSFRSDPSASTRQFGPFEQLPLARVSPRRDFTPSL